MLAEIQKHSKSFFSALINLFFPRCCIVCGTPLMQGEDFLCTNCRIGIPRTRFHLLRDNPIEQMFWGRVKLERATSFFYYYRSSAMCKIVISMKYGGRKEIGESMGRTMATEIAPSGFFEGIDMLLPIPLHSQRQKDRGYNQSEWIAKGIAAITHLPIEMDVIERHKNIESQTRKTLFERWENVQHIFVLRHPEKIVGKHVLVIDDVLTTGATSVSFMETFAKVEGIKISLLTLAVVNS